MRKEIIIAILGGIIFGLIVAFGIWRANSALEMTEVAQINEGQQKNTPTITNNNNELKIVIANFENNDVVTANPIEVTGLTKSNSWVSISAEEEDFILQSNDQGEFKQEIDLIGGVNQIVIWAYDDGGKTLENLTLVYSTEF